mmetsp:Transcript_66827/g.150949  ORF Transcript_66827/g.150949 Transcript_66827/m.150949 type:complete len:243 (+) Transcript_66827:937-1665(+)
MAPSALSPRATRVSPPKSRPRLCTNPALVVVAPAALVAGLSARHWGGASKSAKPKKLKGSAGSWLLSPPPRAAGLAGVGFARRNEFVVVVHGRGFVRCKVLTSIGSPIAAAAPTPFSVPGASGLATSSGPSSSGPSRGCPIPATNALSSTPRWVPQSPPSPAPEVPLLALAEPWLAGGARIHDGSAARGTPAESSLGRYSSTPPRMLIFSAVCCESKGRMRRQAKRNADGALRSHMLPRAPG